MVNLRLLWTALVVLFFCLGLISCNNTYSKEELINILQKKISTFPNHHVEDIKIVNNNLNIYISDSLDVNNPPYTNEFITHFYRHIKNELSSFDSVSTQIRIVAREDDYQNHIRYLPVSHIQLVVSAIEKNPSYISAMDWILRNDYRVEMEIANVRYAQIRDIKDIWSVTNNIFGFMQTYYQECENPEIVFIIEQLDSSFTSEEPGAVQRAQAICSKIFSNCTWIED